MSDQSLPYVIHSDEECERLELQARLANIEGHLRHLPIAGAHRVLDVGCGSGSMSRLIARSFPEVEVVGVDVREQYLDYAPTISHSNAATCLLFHFRMQALIWCGANIFCNG
jgi:cyclopropane fatty-acyl-phospholipid synthase-like methyltransferase